MTKNNADQTPPKIILFQCRSIKDPMSFHERECISKKLCENFPVDLEIINPIYQNASTALLDDCDGIIFGGSGDYSVYHPKSRVWCTQLLKVMEEAIKRKHPAFGICFGHQLLGQFLGAEVKTDEKHAEIGTVSLELTEAGKKDDFFNSLSDTFFAQSGHTDYVSSIPNGLELMVRGDKLETQGFKVIDAAFYSSQFHPDLTGREARDRYLAYKAKMSESEYSETQQEATCFELGRDEGTKLLPVFAELVKSHKEYGDYVNIEKSRTSHSKSA